MDQSEHNISEIIDNILKPESAPTYAQFTALSGIGKQDLIHFQKRWTLTDVNKRIRVISRLVELAEDDFALDFTSLFVQAVSDASEEVRVKGIEGLQLEDKHTYIKHILQAVGSDESEEVRAAAAAALGKFALMASLDELPSHVADDIFQALISLLESTRESILVKRRALESVSAFQQAPVYVYIEDYYYSEDPLVKASAIYAMGRNCDRRWLPFLIDEMQSSTPEFKYEAAQSCGELEDEEAVPCLISLTEDDDREVREAAISALGKIGSREARQQLQNLAKHADLVTSEAATAALAGSLPSEDPLSLNF